MSESELERDVSDIADQIKIEEHQYLTFLLQEELFAIRVLDIIEIIEYKQITRVPMMQDFIEGVTNIRGNVVPVLNLAQAFGMGLSPVTNRTCIVMVHTILGDTDTSIGLVVDLVKEVYDIMPEQMELPPPFGMHIRREYIQNIGKVQGLFIHILDLDTILSLKRLSRLKIERQIV